MTDHRRRERRRRFAASSLLAISSNSLFELTGLALSLDLVGERVGALSADPGERTFHHVGLTRDRGRVTDR